MAPRLRSSSAPLSPSLLGLPPIASHPSPPSRPNSDFERASSTPLCLFPPLLKSPPSPTLGDNFISSSFKASSNPVRQQPNSCPPMPTAAPPLQQPSTGGTGEGPPLPQIDAAKPQLSPSAQPPKKNWSEHLFPAARKMQRVGSPGTHVSGVPLVTIPEESLEESSKE
ncbi:PREDICTED: proline-rich extensin-like protein EPR1 [Tarenaya hassleriana]|uniref:proline-rich extensin-like protein EPR1 n=1 Tax=Tarenaya hassleriana TaxID=28532 RepID=UPI00053C76E0|nr:PREDICTED: proline-rich extensin-like protein EPR1 [Tarenaya hassleriana]